ncbi:MAG TPA: DUF6798 domain-containing protein [Pirellulales bacterium]|jgi:hypothetical protein|nr:DUF6798 domain-containing protein [Pirellulales bacterium]
MDAHSARTFFTSEPVRVPAAPRWLGWLEVALIFAMFSLYAGWPIPDVNEAHYLAKAKHYWNPSWCQGDLFVDSTDAHQVFFWSFGWLTLFFPLPVVACIGRVVVNGLLAYSWRRLMKALAPDAGAGPRVLSAVALIIASEYTQLAGEWIIGGIEAKGFAFVGVFLALEALVRGRWGRMWLWLGLASAFHVLVGGWSAIICFGVWLAAGRRQYAFWKMLPYLLACGLLAAPSIYFGLHLAAGAAADTISQADQIQYLLRIHHHLNPMMFKVVPITVQLSLFILYLLINFGWRPTRDAGRLVGFVIGAALIALAGYLLWLALRSHPDLAAKVLRYYWFRLFDFAVPVGIGSLLVTHFPRLFGAGRRDARTWLAAAAVAAGLMLGYFGWQRATTTVSRADKYAANFPDFLDVCRWAKTHTEPNDLFMVPAAIGTFRFYADRPEVANWKDMPQDPRSIVEWWRRMIEVHKALPDDPHDPTGGLWRITLGALGTDRLQALAHEFHARYVVVVTHWNDMPDDFALPKIDLSRVYHNAHYDVYRF